MIFIDNIHNLKPENTISGFLGSAQNTPFVVPKFQRPYTWTIDTVETFFDDIWTFTIEKGGFNNNGDAWFIGAFVGFYEKDPALITRFISDNSVFKPKGENVLNIVDGQQRLTTIFLLLRVIYKHLENQVSDKVNSFKKEIQNIIWRIKDKRTDEVDYTIPMITSLAVEDKYNEVFKRILITGNADKNARDSYSVNYLYLEKLLEEKLKEQSSSIEDFYETVLHQVIFLPIITENIETALSVFNTLNNRGQPLTDADVFKALLYGNAEKDNCADKFIEAWNQLTASAEHVGLTTQNLFSFYMNYLKGKNGEKRTGSNSIRDFYLKGKYLYSASLMEDLRKISNLLRFIQKREEIPNEVWCNNFEIQKTLDILRQFQTDYWKYPVICYYLSHRNSESFENNFSKFLKALLSVLIRKFIVSPTVRSIQSIVRNIDVEACKDMHPNMDFEMPSKDEVQKNIPVSHYKLTKLLLCLDAYLNVSQKTLLPLSLEIEHILARNYKTVSDEPEETVLANLEHLGNKVLLEKIPNIEASDKWFQLKKASYSKSTVASAKDLADLTITSWTTNQIIERDAYMKDRIYKYFEQAMDEYNGKTVDATLDKDAEIARLRARLAELEASS